MTRASPLAILAFALGAGACSDLSTEPDRTPASLRIVPDTARVVQGDAVQFDVEVLDQDGVPFESPPFGWAPPAWSSSAVQLLELNETGEGRALEPGESRARVELAGLASEAVVRANPTELELSVPFVYVTQSTQRRSGTVPLVAGRSGLVRVYVQGGVVNFFEPQVRVTFYQGDTEVHDVLLEPEGPSVPDQLDEGDLALSYDAVVPGSVLQPGVSLAVEVDPDGRVPTTPSSQLRVPAAGSLPLEVREVPPFRLRLVPVRQSANERESRITAASVPTLTQRTEDIFPLSAFDVDVREPFTTTAELDTEDGWFQLIEEILLLRQDDGSDRYYYGGFDAPNNTGLAGLGYVGYPTSIGVDNQPTVLAHELGHNLGLPHAPCGGAAGVDQEFPYPDASIGQYGYERAQNELYDPEDRHDLMSYCRPVWISDYNYEKVLAYRDTSAFDAVTEAAAPAPDGQTTVLVWGGVQDGRLVLEPALSGSGAVALPSGRGRYTLEGLDAAGRRLFAVAFEPLALDHGAGRHFVFALPDGLAGGDRLETLRVSGPEGRVERSRRAARGAPTIAVRRRAGAAAPAGEWSAASYPLALVRSRATGRVVALSRSGSLSLPRDPGSVDVWLSDGVRTHRARVER